MSLINDALKRAKQVQAQHAPSPPPTLPLEPVPDQPASRGGLVFWLVPVAAVFFFVLSFWFFSLWWRSSRSSLAHSSTVQPAKVLVASAASPVSAAPRVTPPGPSNILTAVHDTPSSQPLAGAAPVKPVRQSTGQPGREPINPGREGSVSRSGHASSASHAGRDRGGPKSTRQTALAKAEPHTVASVPSVSASAGNPPATAAASAPVTAASPPSSGSERDQQTSSDAPQFAPAQVRFPDLKLQAIFYRLSKASVLINGQTMFIGDEIEGARLVGIDRYTARLAMNGQTNVLRLR